MPIDWFTVVAQAINFLILVWLLKRFLYKPILHAIDEREKGIAAQLAEAEAKKAEAQKERDDFQHKNEAFRPGACSALEKSHGRGQSRTSAAARRSTKGCRFVACQTPGSVAKRTTEPESRNHPLDPEGSLCHRAKDAGGPRRHEPRGTHGRCVRPPPARVDRRGKGAVGGRPQDLDPSSAQCAAHSICRRHSGTRSKVRSRKPSPRILKSSSRPRRNWSAASNSPPTDRRWPGASRIISRRWKRAPANFCTRMPSPKPASREAQAQR